MINEVNVPQEKTFNTTLIEHAKNMIDLLKAKRQTKRKYREIVSNLKKLFKKQKELITKNEQINNLKLKLLNNEKKYNKLDQKFIKHIEYDSIKEDIKEKLINILIETIEIQDKIEILNEEIILLPEEIEELYNLTPKPPAEKSIKIRIYPTKEQKTTLSKWFGVSALQRDGFTIKL